MRRALQLWRGTRARLRALKGWRLGLALFVAGLVSGAGFAPFHVQPVYLVALCVLVLSLDDARRAATPLRSGFWRGYAFAAGAFLVGTFWVANAFLERGGAYAAFFWVPLVFLPAGLALFWGAAGALYARLSRPGPGRIVDFAVLFMLAEYVRATQLSGFPWNLPGPVWAAGGAVSQSASLVGAAGLSAVTLLVLASPAALAGRGSARARASVPILAALVLAGLIGYGQWRLSSIEIQETGRMVRVVKLGLPQSQRRYENRQAMLERYIELTAGPELARADAVIWPEGALPALTLREPDLLARMGEVLAGTPLILGTTRVDTEVEPDLYYNALAVLAFGDDGPRLGAVYDKARLVPFGEGNPVRPLTELVGFQSLATNSPFYTPGAGARAISVAGLPAFAPLICYEVIYPGYVREAAPQAQWLLNISNDSWYGGSTGPYQHLNQARFRAIETGLPLIRSASAGVSGLVDPLGRGVALTALKSSEALNIPILADIREPFYARRGDAPWAIVLVVLLLLVRLPWSFMRRQGR